MKGAILEMSEVETKVEEVKATTAKKKRMSVKDLTTLGLLTGILLVMAFTPLGYFHTLGVDISLMMNLQNTLVL